ncbi:hypothetical protein MMC30_009333 [Trapelia coarctata]|nr:hypothetical protein [Trapelia coarctata]
MPNRAIAGAFDGPFMLLFLISVDALVLQRLHLAEDGIERVDRRHSRKKLSGRSAGLGTHSSIAISSLWDAVAWAFHVIFSYRAIGSLREAKNIPMFSYKDPSYVPSRSRLLFERGFAILAGFLFVDFVSHQPPPRSELFRAHNASLFPAMSDMTVEDIIVRVFSTAFFWSSLHITISLIYNTVSFIGLATFLTSPADWPPYFGRVKDAYTLRRFWAVFWHSGLRNALLGTADFCTYDILRLPRRTVWARYAKISLTFAISGIIHRLVDDTNGIPESENTVYILFLLQALGIMIEDGVELGYHKLQSKGQRRVKPRPTSIRGWQKVVGYIWVGAWLVWTTPSWSYANIRHDGDQLFPFSAIEFMKTWRV